MLTYSRLLNKYYDAEKVVYITNMLQAHRYLNHGGEDYLMDILYDSRHKHDKLVFVFEKNTKIKELYNKWQNHELN